MAIFGIEPKRHKPKKHPASYFKLKHKSEQYMKSVRKRLMEIDKKAKKRKKK